MAIATFSSQGLADEAAGPADAGTQGAWPDGLGILCLDFLGHVIGPFARTAVDFRAGPAAGGILRGLRACPGLLEWCPRWKSIKADLAHPTSDRIIEVMIVATSAAARSFSRFFET